MAKKAKPKNDEPEVEEEVQDEPVEEPTEEPVEEPETPAEPEPFSAVTLMSNRNITAANERLGGDAGRILASAGERKCTKSDLPEAEESSRKIYWLTDSNSLAYSDGEKWCNLMDGEPV